MQLSKILEILERIAIVIQFPNTSAFIEDILKTSKILTGNIFPNRQKDNDIMKNIKSPYIFET